MITLLDIAIFASISSFVGLTAAVATRKPVKDATIPVVPQLQVRRDRLLAHDRREKSPVVQFDRWLERMLVRAAIPLDRDTYLLLILCTAFASGAVAVTLGLPMCVAVGIASAVVAIGVLVCYIAMVSRLAKFEKQFPTALELLARATRAGESLENGFRIAGESSEGPVQEEFAQCVRQMSMGLPPDIVAADLAERIDSANVHMLAHTISIHQTLGGPLASSLERLSSVIRERTQCVQKIKSLTSIGRYSVIAIVLMGLFVLGYMLTSQPDYIDNLFTSSLGNKLLIYAGISELVGLIWVGLTLKSDLN